MNNYQPQGLVNNGLVNGGYLWTPTSADANLLNQQTKYAALCQSYIGSVSFTRDGKDVTDEIQRKLIMLSQSVPMTAASAQVYFPGVNVLYWVGGVIDWLAGYNTIKAYVFV